MRQIILDTETTGLEADRGHRIIEIGCVELLNRRVTGRRFHRYLNPERDIDEGALAVHGITRAQLEREPRFHEIAGELLAFCDGAELVIHNAAFDVGFLDNELMLAGPAHGRLGDHARVLDTLALARERFPGQRNSLDALCKRLGVDNSHRELHGALLDAQLLTEVYLALTAGQGDLGLAVPSDRASSPAADCPVSAGGVVLAVRRAAAEEVALHRERLEQIARASGGKLAWPPEPSRSVDSTAVA